VTAAYLAASAAYATVAVFVRLSITSVRHIRVASKLVNISQTTVMLLFHYSLFLEGASFTSYNVTLLNFGTSNTMTAWPMWVLSSNVHRPVCW